MDLQEWHRWWKQAGASELRELLLSRWDPIGVREAPEAQDEYDGYLGPLGSLLRRGVTANGVAEYLAWCEGRMGFDTQADRLTQVATGILDWYRAAIATAEPGS